MWQFGSNESEYLGVAQSTLRRWDGEGKLKSERTPAGHRRYDLDNLKRLAIHCFPLETARLTLAYARASSHDPKEDLVRQALLLSEFCTKNGWTFEVIEDLGSGLNYQKRGRLTQTTAKRNQTGGAATSPRPPDLVSSSHRVNLR
jgi:putative resolvase